MAEFDFTQAIGEARAKYESIAKALDVDRLKADIKDLETQAAAPGPAGSVPADWMDHIHQ